MRSIRQATAYALELCNGTEVCRIVGHRLFDCRACRPSDADGFNEHNTVVENALEGVFHDREAADWFDIVDRTVIVIMNELRRSAQAQANQDSF